MNTLFRVLIIVTVWGLFQKREVLAKEPKTVDEAIDLLNEQQTKFFPYYTFEFELSKSEINKGREILQHWPFPKIVKFRAAKNKDEYVHQVIEKPVHVVWFYHDFFVYSKKGALRFNNALGPVGAAFISGYPGAVKDYSEFPCPENLFGAMNNTHEGVNVLKQKLADKTIVGWIEKVPLDWPSLPETIHIRLQYASGSRHEIYLDPNQGYLPVKLLTYHGIGRDKFGDYDPNNPKLGSVTTVLESKEVEKGKFLPTKVAVFWPKNRAPDETQECTSLFFNVTKLDYGKKPSEEELSLPLPEGCIVGTDLGVEGPYITFRRNENVKPSDIPRIISMLQKQQESMEKRGERAIQDTALIDPPPSRGWSSYLWWAVGGLALLSLLLYLLRRFSRKV